MPAQYTQNTSYWSEPAANGRLGFSKLRAVAQKNVADLASKTWKNQRTGIPADFQSLSTISSNAAPISDQPQFPANQPIGEAFSDKYKNLQQYRTDTWEALPTQTSQPWYTPETPTTRIANMPSFLWSGQYLTDPNSANVANERTYVPEENKMILWTRDPRLYQVDHIIPLWAGGADTIANKEILTTADHAVKSKTQAVPFTLMAKGLISPQEAKNAAINWQWKDIVGIPSEAEKWGFIDENLAQEKYAEWKRVQKPWLFSKEFFQAIPEVLKWVTKGLSSKTGDDPTSQFLKSMAGWFAQEASFGIFPYQNESTDASSKAGAFVGQIGGSVLAFAGLGWLLWAAGKVASKAKYLKSFANSAKIWEDVFKGGQMTREGAQVATEWAWFLWGKIWVAVKWAGVWDAITTSGKSGFNNVIKNIKINNVLKSTWMMNAYGQLRITAPGLVWLEEMPDLNQRFQQAMVDTAYGWLLWQAGHTIPGYAGVWAGAFTIWLISGDDAEDATLNAFTMMALHWLWQGAANKKAKLPTLEEAMNRTADQTASQHIFDKTWIKIDKLNPDTAINVREKLNAERAKVAAKGDVDLAELSKMRLQDEVAIRQLEKGWMTTALRRQADIEDMKSVWEKTRTKEQLQDTSTPDEVVQTVLKNEDHLFKNTPLEKTEWGNISWAKQPVGRFPLTGVAEQIGKGEPRKRVDYFFNAKEKWLAADNVLLVERSELKNFFEELNVTNKTLRSKDIANNDLSLMQHPENSVQAFWVVKVSDPSIEPLPWVVRIKWSEAPLDIIPLWWVARKDRIASVSEWGRNRSFNQNTINRFWENAWADMFDPSYNKDLLAESVRNNWMKVVTATLNPISTARTKDWHPFVVVDVKPENWSSSLELNKQRIWQSTWDNISTLVTKASQNNDPQAVVNVIQKIREKSPDTWAAKIMNKMADQSKDPDTAFAADVLNTFEAWLESWSAKQLKETVNKKYGAVLDDNTSLQLVSNKDVFTAENAFDILHDWVQNGTANIGTAIMYKNNLMPLFEKINSNKVTIDWIPVNSFYHKMPLLSDKAIGIKPETPKEKPYEKYNTFNTDKKNQEFDAVKKDGVELIENFEIKWQESDSSILNRMQWQVDSLIDTYKWNTAEKQQAKDMLMGYAKDKIAEQRAPVGEYVDNFDTGTVNPKKGLNKNTESVKPTSLTSMYPDIYKSGERSNPLANKIASKMTLQQLMDRSSKTNKNTLANDIQASATKSEAEGKKNTALLWNDVLKEFDRLGSSADWRNKEIDNVKFNENMKRLSSDTIVSWPRAGSPKTVNPEIASYEMDINIGRTENLPKELQNKYKELQEKWYGHVYSSSTMGENAFKWRTPAESSINMFKYIKEHAEKGDDRNLVKEIFWDNSPEAEKALEAIKTWRLGDELTTNRLANIEKEMYGDKAPGIAQKLEDRKIDLNRWVSKEMIESDLSPISLEDFKEVPEFNNPLSHAIMSLSKYNINELSQAEINKLAKSMAFTLWPSVKNSLKGETKPTEIKKITPKKQDGKWGPGDSLAQWLTQWAKDFSGKINSQNFTPKIDKTKTILWKSLNPPTVTQNSQLPAPLSEPVKPNNIPPTPTVDKQSWQLWRILSLVESSGWTNKKNEKLDQGKYGYVVWFTKGTYNDILKKASEWDARYKDLLSKMNFDTPEAAQQSAIHYFNFRNTLYWDWWKVMGKKYTNPEDIYTNLYNASSPASRLAARKNWQNVVRALEKSK